MKKKLFIISFLLSITVIIVILAHYKLSFEGENIKYNNTKKMEDSITCKYAESDIMTLKNNILKNQMSFPQLKSQYLIQCLRKTYQGYYAVMLLENNGLVFIFIDNNYKLYNVLIVDKFSQKTDFDFILPGVTCQSQVLSFDKNAMLSPLSSVEVTSHIVKEGVIIVKYTRLEDGFLLDDPVVDSVEFISNDNLTDKDNRLVGLNIPIILAIDKQ